MFMDKPPVALSLQNVGKSYGAFQILNQFSLQICAGETYALLGANGAGKTTALRIISGLLSADTGEGYCLNTPLAEKPFGLAYMPQYGGLYQDLTVQENLTFFARAHSLSEIRNKVHTTLYTHDLIERKNQRVSTLSGGWRQRVALAIALLASPQFLLLDEPTAGLDPAARDALWLKLYALTKTGVSILVTTHYVDEAERCNRVGYLNQGKITAEGVPNQLAESLGLVVWHVTDITPIPQNDATLAIPAADGWRLICSLAVNQTNQVLGYYDHSPIKPERVPAKLSDALSWLVANKAPNHEK